MKYEGNYEEDARLGTGDDCAALLSVGGRLLVTSKGVVSAPLLVSVGGLYVCKGATLGATLDAPLLMSAENVDVDVDGVLNAPLLTSAGDVYVDVGGEFFAPLLGWGA